MKKLDQALEAAYQRKLEQLRKPLFREDLKARKFTEERNRAEQMKAALDQATRALAAPAAPPLQEWAQQAAKQQMRDSLRGTAAERLARVALSQQGVLDAFGRIPDSLQAQVQVWLRMECPQENPEVELVDYTLSPVGQDPGVDGALNTARPMAVSRAESGSVVWFLPLREPLWLVGLDVVPALYPRPRITLVVRHGHGPHNIGPSSILPTKPAVRAADQVRRVQATEIERLRFAGAAGGTFKGERWACNVGELPILFVPAEFSTARAGAVTDREWQELYARLVLGEDVEDS